MEASAIEMPSFFCFKLLKKEKPIRQRKMHQTAENQKIEAWEKGANQDFAVKTFLLQNIFK
jgi:hypothetical protein